MIATPTLCPSATNELGTGILPPDEESALLAEGMVFAYKRHIRSQRRAIIFCCDRPFEGVATDLILDAHHGLRGTRRPSPAPVAAAR